MDSLIFTEDSNFANANFTNVKDYVKRNCLFKELDLKEENDDTKEMRYFLVDENLRNVHYYLEVLFFNKFYNSKQEFFDELKTKFKNEHKMIYSDLMNGCLITYSKKGGVKLNSCIEKTFNYVVGYTLGNIDKSLFSEGEQVRCGDVLMFPAKYLNNVQMLINFYRLTLKFANSTEFKMRHNLSIEKDAREYAMLCSVMLTSHAEHRKPGEYFKVANYQIDFPKQISHEVESKLEGTNFRFREISEKLYFDNYYCNSSFFAKETDGEDVSYKNEMNVITEMKSNLKDQIIPKFLKQGDRFVKDLFYICFDKNLNTGFFDFMLRLKDTMINSKVNLLKLASLIILEREDLNIGNKDFFSLGDFEAITVFLQSYRISIEKTHGLLNCGEINQETIFDPLSCIEILNFLKYNKLSWFNASISMLNIHFLLNHMTAVVVLKSMRSMICTMWERRRNIVEFSRYVTKQVIIEMNYIFLTTGNFMEGVKKVLFPAHTAITLILNYGVNINVNDINLHKFVFKMVQGHISNIENFTFSKVQVEDAVNEELKYLLEMRERAREEHKIFKEGIESRGKLIIEEMKNDVRRMEEIKQTLTEEEAKRTSIRLLESVLNNDKYSKKEKNQIFENIIPEGQGPIESHLIWSVNAKGIAREEFVVLSGGVDPEKIGKEDKIRETVEYKKFMRATNLVERIENLIVGKVRWTFLNKKEFIITYDVSNPLNKKTK